MPKEVNDTKNIALYCMNLSSEGSKASDMFIEVLENVKDWDIGKSNRWLGYAQCLLVAEGATTIDELRVAIRKIINKES